MLSGSFGRFNGVDCFRYDVVISSDVARTRTNGCIFFKLRDPSVDLLPTHYYSHKFVCVAPYNTDTLLLINIPKTMLEKVIKVRQFCRTYYNVVIVRLFSCAATL